MRFWQDGAEFLQVFQIHTKALMLCTFPIIIYENKSLCDIEFVSSPCSQGTGISSGFTRYLLEETEKIHSKVNTPHLNITLIARHLF